MRPLSQKATGTLVMVLAVTVLSPDAMLISIVSADSWTLVFWRGLLTAGTLSLAMVTGYGGGAASRFRHIGWAGIVSSLFFAASTICFVMSVRLTAAANTLVIIAAMPLFAAILTRLFLGEAVPRRTWAAVVAGLAGIGLVFYGGLRTGGTLGDLLAAATALLMASNFVIIRKYRHVNMIPAVILSGAITTVITAFMCDPLPLGVADVVYLCVMGSVVLPVPLSLMTVGPKLIPAAEVSLIMLLETFLGPFWVWVVLAEKPARETFLGGGILVITIVVHALAGLRKGDEPPLLPDT